MPKEKQIPRESLNTLAGRLEVAMSEAGYTQESLADAVNTSQATISRILNNITQRSQYLGKIAKVLNVSEQWLMFGDQSNVEKPNVAVKTWDKDTALPDSMIAVPYFKDMTLSAGHGALNSDIAHSGSVLWFSKSFLRRQGACPEKVFCITVAGDSMEPRYEEGGIVIIDTTLPINVIDGKAYAIHYEGEDFIKYLRRLPGNQLLITSENKIYEPFKMDADDVKIIGRVIGYQRED